MARHDYALAFHQQCILGYGIYLSHSPQGYVITCRQRFQSVALVGGDWYPAIPQACYPAEQVGASMGLDHLLGGDRRRSDRCCGGLVVELSAVALVLSDASMGYRYSHWASSA